MNDVLLDHQADPTIQTMIAQQIANHHIVLYMKGEADAPKCHFSAQVVAALKACHAEFMAINVLEQEAIRSGIKTYSNWPTIPQLYINHEFIGGCDIIKELFRTGELQQKIASCEKSR